MPSYRARGYWATVFSQVKRYKATHSVFVTIQFGHNDQKVAAYEAAHSANLKQFVLDVDNAGGIPVGYQSLANETTKGLAVAHATGSRVMDLNKASATYVNAIGPTVCLPSPSSSYIF
jgi:predicted TIM-barrel enzyme